MQMVFCGKKKSTQPDEAFQAKVAAVEAENQKLKNAIVKMQTKLDKKEKQWEEILHDKEKALQVVFDQQKLIMENNEFSAKIEQMEREQKQMLDERDKNTLTDHFKAISERIGELEQRQQKLYENMANASECQFKAILHRIDELERQKPGRVEQKEGVARVTRILEEKRVMLLKNPLMNCWDAMACHEGLQISGNKCLTVRCTTNGHWRSVFAKFPILLNNDFSATFYFEISLKNLESFAILGFADKHRAKLDESLFGIPGTFAFAYVGDFCLDGSWKGRNAKHSFGVGDVVGVGVHLANRRVFFTKNGLSLDTSASFIVPSFSSACDQLFPFVSLCSFGGEIEANFGLFIESAEEREKQEEEKQEEMGPPSTSFSVQPNCWDALACDEGIEIIGENNLTVCSMGGRGGWRSVFAKHQILLHNHSPGIFYFEIAGKDMKFRRVVFGVTVKKLNKFGRPTKHYHRRKVTYAFGSSGCFYVNGFGKQMKAECAYGVGDVVGIGVHFANRLVFITKNGLCLDSSYLLDASSVLFPFISLRDFCTKIEANFGPNFKFDLASP